MLSLEVFINMVMKLLTVHVRAVLSVQQQPQRSSSSSCIVQQQNWKLTIHEWVRSWAFFTETPQKSWQFIQAPEHCAAPAPAARSFKQLPALSCRTPAHAAASIHLGEEPGVDCPRDALPKRVRQGVHHRPALSTSSQLRCIWSGARKAVQQASETSPS